MNKPTFHRQFLIYLAPSMLTMVLMAVYTFTDTFVVGQSLGNVALGAMGVCTPVLTITYAFGFLFGMGGASLYAVRMGQGKKEEANQIFTTAVFSTLVFGIVAAIILNIEIIPFAYLLGADDANISFVIPYLRVLLIYIPGFMMDIVMMCFMKNEGHPNIAMAATVIGTGMNVALDFLFVFGFGWGMFGAAFATALCSGIGCVINISCAFAKKMNIRIRPGNFRLNLVPTLLSSGVSILILEASSGVVTFIFINRANALYGSIGASVYTIIMNWSLICTNLIMGIAQAMQPLVSTAYGKEDRASMQAFRSIALRYSIIFGIAFQIIGYLLTTPLVSVFATDSQELIDITCNALRLYLPAFLLMSVGICIGYYFQSIGQDLKSMIIMLLRGIALPVAFAFLFPLCLGETGLWISVPAAELITSVLAIILLNRKKARSNMKMVNSGT